MSSSAEHPDAMSAEAMAARIAALQAELAAKDAEHAAKVAALEDSLTDLAHENALLKRRLFGNKTERLQTIKRLRELTESTWAAPADPLEKNRADLDVERQRRHLEARARRSFITDCLREVRQVFRSSLDDEEKRLHLRTVVESYGVEVGDLPQEIQKFLAGRDDEFDDEDEYEDDDDDSEEYDDDDQSSLA